MNICSVPPGELLNKKLRNSIRKVGKYYKHLIYKTRHMFYKH